MVRQSDYPDKWACTSEQKRVAVEIRVAESRVEDLAAQEFSGASEPTEVTGSEAEQLFSGAAEPSSGTRDYTWIEIPTESVELWVEKGDAAQIQRTAKVRFPTEWGRNTDDVVHNSPRRLVERFTPTDTQPFMMARIWFQQNDGTWVLNHFGWMGGIGPASDPGLSKFWVYDLAELLSSVPIGETFNNPTTKQALEIIAKLTNSNTPIPVANTILMPPESDAEFKQLASNIDLSFLEQVDVFLAEDIGLVPAEKDVVYYSLSTDEFISLGEPRPDGPVLQFPKEVGESFEAITLDTGDIPIAGMDEKSFVSNHDTLLDVYKWFEKKTSAKLHFEPQPDAVSLIADIVPERRTFAQVEIIERAQEQTEPIPGFGDVTEYDFHEPVTVMKNNALYEMKPMNTLHLRGSTASGLLDPLEDFLDTAGAQDEVPGWLTNYEPPAEKYPVVTVQAPSLIEAAEGVELSPPVVESDASQLDTAEKEATRLLSDRLEEATEGEIVLAGEPKIMPFDRLDAFEVCQGNIEYEQTPATYEVESAKHVAKAGKPYRTVLNVSVWANDESIEVTRSAMVEVD